MGLVMRALGVTVEEAWGRVAPAVREEWWRWTSSSAMEVNHRVPVLGRHGENGCHHHQDGIETLCHGCHVDVTNAQRRNGWRPVPLQPAAGAQLLLEIPLEAAAAAVQSWSR